MSRPPPQLARTRAGPAAVCLTVPEVRSLLRLGNVLRDSPADPAGRKKRLLEGLCRLVRADAGVCLVTHAAVPAGRATVVSMARFGIAGEDADAFAAHFLSAAPQARTRPGTGRAAAADHRLESVVPVAGAKVRACVALFRRHPGREPFSSRERSMLDLFHSESAWLYRLDLPLVSPAGLSLTPRQRQTLQLLLSGHGEKQIAAHLGLSPNTVHHYVKAIHRHFRVSSRSELLARWVTM
jgi:DNA-binding CsgD family transcriptional regulator